MTATERPAAPGAPAVGGPRHAAPEAGTDKPKGRRLRRLRLGAGWHRGAPDAVTLLTFYLILLFGVPARLVFAPLGGAGSPATLLGVAALLWWAGHRLLMPDRGPAVRQPVRRAMLLLVLAILASYVAGTVRPIDDVELRAADRGLLTVMAWLGILLVAMDGIPTRQRLDALLRRLVVSGGALAVLGLAQFQTGQSFTNLVQIPGLSQNSDLTVVIDRGGFSRPAGTALHPIEFGIVLTMILPLALHYAFADRHRGTVRRWAPAVLIALDVPVSISRSAIVCTAVVLAFMLPTWPQAVRRRAYAAMVALLGVVFVAVPGMLGTLTGLFSGIGSDSSAQSRTGSYAIAGEFISRSPVFGRGFQTFLPAYHILDNQYLLATIETGVVGVLALLGVFVVGVRCARRIRRMSRHEPTRQLGQALAASVAAGMASFALFDALSFPQTAGLVFLVLGITGALWRLESLRPAAPGPSSPARVGAGTGG